MVGGFRVIRLLDSTGRSAVWLARDQKLRRDIALKFVRKEDLPRFTRLATLRHAGVAATHGVGEFENLGWVATEYVDGPTINDALAGLGPDMAMDCVLDAGILIAEVSVACREIGISEPRFLLKHLHVDRERRVKWVGLGADVAGEGANDRDLLIATLLELLDLATGDRSERRLSDRTKLESRLRRAAAGPDESSATILKSLFELRDSRRQRPKRRVAVVATLVLTSSVITATSIATLTQRRCRTSRSIARAVAVLPLESAEAAGSPMAWLSDGIGRTLAAKLSRVPGLRVVPWTSIRSLTPPAMTDRALAERFDVDAVLRGRFRTEGDEVELELELHDARSGTLSWSARSRTSINGLLSLQEARALAIAERLVGALDASTRQALASETARNVGAFQSYLRGAAAMSAGADATAQTEFASALDIDPSLAEAWLGIGAIATRRYYAGTVGEDALETAESAFRRALELQPDLHAARRGMIRVLWERGAGVDAMVPVALVERAADEDAEAWLCAADALLFGGLPELAIPLYDHAATLQPGSNDAVWHAFVASAFALRWEQAVDRGTRYLRTFGEDPEVALYVGMGLVTLGRPVVASRHADTLVRHVEGGGLRAGIESFVVALLRRLGRVDDADRIALQAILTLEDGLEQGRDNGRVRAGLAALYGLVGDAAGYDRHANETRRFTTSFEVAGEMGIGLAALGRDDELAALLQESINAGVVVPTTVWQWEFAATRPIAGEAWRAARRRFDREHRRLTDAYVLRVHKWR